MRQLLGELAGELARHRRRYFLRSLPMAVQLSLFFALYLLTGSPAFLFVSIGFSVGWLVGGSLSYRWGMKDRAEILDDTFGADWTRVLATQKAREAFQERREAAPHN